MMHGAFFLGAYSPGCLFACFGFRCHVDLAGWRNRGDGVFENGLYRLVVATQQDHILVKGLDLADEFDAIHQKYRAMYMLTP